MALLTNFYKNQPFDKFVKDVVLKLAEESPDDKRLLKINIHWRPFNRHILEMLEELNLDSM